MRDGWKYEDYQRGIHEWSTGRCDKIGLRQDNEPKKSLH